MAFSLSYTSAIKPAEHETGECEEMRRLKFISSASRAYALPSIQRKCAYCNDCYSRRQFCLSLYYRRNGAWLGKYFLSFPEPK